MFLPRTYRWRKTTDINRENAVFELLADDVPILDVGFSDAGVFEVVFNPGIAGVTIEWAQLLHLVAEGKKRAELDR